MNLRRWSLAVCVVFGLTLSVAACSDTRDTQDDRDPLHASNEIAWGPFEVPAIFAGQLEISGPTEIQVPDIGEIRLDAADFFPESEFTSQWFGYAYDGDMPLLFGVFTERIAEAGGVPEHYQTLIHGIRVNALAAAAVANDDATIDGAAAKIPIEAGDDLSIISTRLGFSGSEHEVKFAGVSDLGVVALDFTGDIDPEAGITESMIGVDVVRGTTRVGKDRGAFSIWGQRCNGCCR